MPPWSAPSAGTIPCSQHQPIPGCPCETADLCVIRRTRRKLCRKITGAPDPAAVAPGSEAHNTQHTRREARLLRRQRQRNRDAKWTAPIDID